MNDESSMLNPRPVLWTALAAAFGLLVYLLAPILMPFILSFVLAYIGNPVVSAMERRGMGRVWAVSLAFAVFFVAILALLLGILPLFQKQIAGFVQRVPGYLDWILNVGVPWLQTSLGVDLSSLDLATAKQTLIAHWRDIGGWMGKALTGISRSGMHLFGWIANLALVPLVTFYLLRDWAVLIERIRGLVPPSLQAPVRQFSRETDDVLASFLRGQLSVMASLSVVYAVGLSLVGVELALPLALIAGGVSFVPYLGFIVCLLLAGGAAFLQFQDPMVLVWVLSVFMAGQILESFVLTPYLIGDRLGLHPVAVIFAVMAGGQLFGFTGVLMALPVAAVLVVFLRHVHERYLKTPTSSKGRRKRRKRNRGRRALSEISEIQ